MRSPRGFFAALILLLGVLSAGLAMLAVGRGAEPIIHLALGVGFGLIAFAVFDFRLPAWMTWVGCAATGMIAAIFVLQAVSDLTGNAALTHYAFEVLGQRLERLLGNVFLLWCLAVLLLDSTGRTKLFGTLVLAAIVGLETYSLAVAAPSNLLKLLYIPLFIWLLLECRKERHSSGELTP